MTKPMPEERNSGWLAHLTLGYRSKGGKTILSENIHSGPLTVQRPFYPEGDVCHSYILHPPGGVVGGDRLNLDVSVDSGGSALITTPGATKFYRSIGPVAHQNQQLRVKNGSLEWFPQDTIVFPGAQAQTQTRIDLGAGACFIGWEVLCLGLPVQGEEFAEGSLLSTLALYREGIPLFIDCLRVREKSDLYRLSGLGGYPVSGIFLATGVCPEMLETLRSCLPNSQKYLAGITLLGDLLVGRYLGSSTFEAREVFSTLWQNLRPTLLGRETHYPRIWAT